MEFSLGNNVFLGENGSGKSSVLNQIMMCLFGLTPSDKKFSDLVRRRTKKTEIHLIFKGVDESTYTINKEFNKNGNIKHVIYSILHPKDFIGKGVEGVRKEVKKRLGISESTFRDIVYAQQGEIQKIGDNKSRKGLFDRLLGFERFGDADKNMGGIITQAKLQISSAQKDKTIYESSLTELPLALDKLKKFVTSLFQHKTTKTSIKKNIEKQTTFLEQLRPLKTQYEDFIDKIHRQEGIIEEVKNQTSKDQKKLEQSINKKLENINLPSLETLIKNWKAETKNLTIEIKKNQEKSYFLKKKKKLFDPLQDELNENYFRSKPIIETIGLARNKIESFIDSEFDIRDITALENYITSWEEKSGNLKKSIDEEDQRCNFLKAKRERMRDIEKNIKYAKNNLETTKGYRKRTEDEILKLIPESSHMVRDDRLLYANDFKKQQVYLYNQAKKYGFGIAGGLGFLGLIILFFQPLFGIITLFGAFSLSLPIYFLLGPRRISQRKRNIPLSMIELKKHVKSINEQGQEIKQMKQDLREYSDYDWREIDELENSIRSNRDLMNKTKDLLKTTKSLKNNVITLINLEISLKKCLKLISNLFADFPEVEKIKIDKTIQDLQNTVIDNLILEEISFYDWLEINELEKAITIYLERRNELERHLQYGENLKNDLERLKNLQSKLNKFQENLETVLKKYTPDSFENTEKFIQSLKKDLSVILAQIKILEKETIPSHKNIVKKLEEEVKRYKTAEIEEEKSKELLNLSTILREMYKEIPRILRQEHVERISRHATSLLREMDPESEITEVNINVDYNIRIQRFGDLDEINVLSGGESIIVCLVIRLAFIRALSTCDIAILDEPTAHLDKNRVQELVRILSQQRPLNQLFVVTHDSNFEQVGDVVYKFRKEHGTTHVERSL